MGAAADAFRKKHKKAVSFDAVPPEEDESFLDSAWDAASSVFNAGIDAAKDVGGTLLEGLSYLDKPRGAVAGGVKAALDNTDIIEGIKNGWENNTSWGETAIPEEIRKEHPYLSAAAGFGMDVIADPMWLLPPAKLAQWAGKAGKATGIASRVSPLVERMAGSDIGKRAVAFGEDVLGKNRMKEAGVEKSFNYGMAQDKLIDSDYTDDLARLKQMHDDSMALVTRYIEAAEKPKTPLQLTPQMETDILDSFKNGTMASDIANGVFSKEDALRTLVNAGEEVPYYLLQQHQVDEVLKGRQLYEENLKALEKMVQESKAGGNTARAQALQQARDNLKNMGPANLSIIPDYEYREAVLKQIQDPNLRKAIQEVGDKVIERNKYYTDTLQKAGLIGDEAAVHFQDGSHLRRSYEKYETPEEFREAVRKNGTDEEWKRVNTDYQKLYGATQMGTSPLHKINQQDFIKRQMLSSDTLKKLGLIDDAEYRVTDTFSRARKAVHEQDYLSQVSSLFGKTEEEAAKLSRDLPKEREYVPIPESKAYGELAGKWVPRDIANQVMRRIGTKPDGINKTLQKAVSHWKVGKLANPASIARNFYSGLPMANVFGKVPMKEMPKLMTEVGNAMRLGKKSDLWREYLGSGAKDAKMTREELSNILDGPSKKGLGGMIQKAEEKGMEYFNKPDDFWRAVVFTHYRRQGKSIEDAGEMARNALLDYSNTPDWIAYLARSGIVPFARFPFHAGKETAKALYRNPADVTKYTKPMNQTDRNEQELYPDYLHPQTLLPVGEGTRTVNGQEQKVNNNLDMSYILPFASDISIGNPATDLYLLSKTGRNGLNQEVIRPGMSDNDKSREYAKFLANSVLPTVASPYTLERLYNGATNQVDRKGRQYNLPWSFAQTIAGIKNVPVNTDEMFKNRMTKFQMDERNAKAEINRIKKDMSLSDEEKQKRIRDHMRDIAGIHKDMKKAVEAYQKAKKKD